MADSFPRLRKLRGLTLDGKMLKSYYFIIIFSEESKTIAWLPWSKPDNLLILMLAPFANYPIRVPSMSNSTSLLRRCLPDRMSNAEGRFVIWRKIVIIMIIFFLVSNYPPSTKSLFSLSNVKLVSAFDLLYVLLPSLLKTHSHLISPSDS